MKRLWVVQIKNISTETPSAIWSNHTNYILITEKNIFYCNSFDVVFFLLSKINIFAHIYFYNYVYDENATNIHNTGKL